MRRCSGKSRPEFSRPARTRSRASRTATSGRPTSENAGSPRRTSTSTVTSRLSTPSSAKVVTAGEHLAEARGADARLGAIVYRSRDDSPGPSAQNRYGRLPTCRGPRPSVLGHEHRASRHPDRARPAGRAPGPRAPRAGGLRDRRAQLPLHRRRARPGGRGRARPRVLRGQDPGGRGWPGAGGPTRGHRDGEAPPAAPTRPGVAHRSRREPPAQAGDPLRRDRRDGHPAGRWWRSTTWRTRSRAAR